jgi:hypothetical protein
MSSNGGAPAPERTRREASHEASQQPERGWRRLLLSEVRRHGRGVGTGYTVVSYLLGGLIAYGGIGWLIGRWTGLTHILLPAGMLFGLAVSTGWVIYRYGRS